MLPLIDNGLTDEGILKICSGRRRNPGASQHRNLTIGSDIAARDVICDVVIPLPQPFLRRPRSLFGVLRRTPLRLQQLPRNPRAFHSRRRYPKQSAPSCPGTRTVSTGRGGLPGFSPDGKTISVVPAANLVASHRYTFYWNQSGNVRDINGAYFNGGNSSFTTSSSAVTTAPTVISSNPTNGFTNVPTDLTIQILFSEPIQPTTISGITLSVGKTAIPVTPSLSNGNQTLSLIPPSLLLPNTVYTLSITGVVDLAGNAMPTATQTFTTGAQAVLSRPGATITPVNNATGVSQSIAPTVVFSSPINPLTMTPANVYLVTRSTGQGVPGTLALSADNLTVTFTPAAALDADTQYYLGVFNVSDEAGNLYNGSNTFFTTGP